MKAIIGLRSLGGHNPGNGRIVIGASDFGLVVGLGPTWRGIRTVAVDGQGPVEIASDWVDANSDDEVDL